MYYIQMADLFSQQVYSDNKFIIVYITPTGHSAVPRTSRDIINFILHWLFDNNVIIFLGQTCITFTPEEERPRGEKGEHLFLKISQIIKFFMQSIEPLL